MRLKQKVSNDQPSWMWSLIRLLDPLGSFRTSVGRCQIRKFSCGLKSILAAPEMIHAGETARVGFLKKFQIFPAGQVYVVRKLPSIGLVNLARQIDETGQAQTA